MRRRLIHLALLFYPSQWRRQYGSEFEQFLLDCAADASPIGWTWQLIDACRQGFSERLHRAGPRSRALSIICVCAAAGVIIDAETVTASDAPIGPITPGIVWLAPNALLPADAVIAHAPAWGFPSSFAPVPNRITVQEYPRSSHVVGISGPPATIVLNPKTDRITAVKPGA